MKPSYLYHGDPYTCKAVSLYWDDPQILWPIFNYLAGNNIKISLTGHFLWWNLKFVQHVLLLCATVWFRSCYDTIINIKLYQMKYRVTWYCFKCNGQQGITFILLWTHKRHAISHPHRWARRWLLWIFRRKPTLRSGRLMSTWQSGQPVGCSKVILLNISTIFKLLLANITITLSHVLHFHTIRLPVEMIFTM